MIEREAFKILGLSPTSDLDEIRGAYVNLVKAWHPDRFHHDKSLVDVATKRTQDINRAYATLKSSYKRGSLASVVAMRSVDSNTGSESHWHWEGYPKPPPKCEDYGIPLEEYLRFQSKYDIAFWRSTVTWIAVPSSLIWFNRTHGESGLLPFLIVIGIAVTVAAIAFGVMTLLSGVVGSKHPLYHEIQQYKSALKTWSNGQEREFWDSFRS